MTRDQYAAALRLADILAAENAVLVALDYGRVGEFATEKQAALDALNAASSSGTPDTPTDPESTHRAAALRLKQLVDDNRELLGRAIKVQNHIMGVVAGAARQAQAPAGYGAGGQRPKPIGSNAVALIVRA